MKGWQLALIGVVLGFLMVGIPYIFLRGPEFAWGIYLDWVLITKNAILVGSRNAKEW